MSSESQLIIKSSEGSNCFRIGPRHGDYLKIDIEGQSLRASTRVYLYNDNSSLLKLFEDLSQNWKGWEGLKSWSSLEDDLKIFCSTDKLGHISIKLEVTNNSVEPNWTVSTTSLVDSGRLESMLNEAKVLLA